MLAALSWGKMVVLPQYTTYDVGAVAWDRPALSLGGSPGVQISKTYTTTSTYDFDAAARSPTNQSLVSGGSSVNEQHVLILAPLKNAEKTLPHYFQVLKGLEHPKESTSVGFLIGDEEDNTGPMVVNWVNEQREKGEYRHITLLRKDFGMLSPGRAGRHQNWVQAQRRSIMGKARTFLLTNTLHPTVDWVLWLDSDVEHVPKSLISDLLLHGNAGVVPSIPEDLEEPLGDVIVPNVMYRPHGRGTIQGYDLNSWRETAASLAMKASLSPDTILHEGNRNLPTHHSILARNWVPPNISASWDDTSAFFPLDPTTPAHPPSNLYDPESPAYIGRRIDLDAVGGVATLVRAQTHMFGAVFPSWAEEHQVETEGFGILAKKAGARIVGLPNYLVWHPK